MIMTPKINIDFNSSVAIYRQLINYYEVNILNNTFPKGYQLPSMNQLAEELDISKETAKKVYAILREKGLVKATQGKGFFVAEHQESGKYKVLLILDKLSISKQTLLASFVSTLKDSAEITIQLHNQQTGVLKYFLDEALDLYDYYVITPHFALDGNSQKEVLRQIKRIPNRKLILLDNDIDRHSGKYGAVYQDFANDAYIGLLQGLDKLKTISRLNVITSSSSLYHPYVTASVRKFCSDYSINAEFYDNVTPEIINRNEAYLLLNGQLDMQIIDLVNTAKQKNLKPGRDISIISYNESPICDIIIDGLTTISTDFRKMGMTAAEMILSGKMVKVKNPFLMTRRSSF